MHLGHYLQGYLVESSQTAISTGNECSIYHTLHLVGNTLDIETRAISRVVEVTMHSSIRLKSYSKLGGAYRPLLWMVASAFAWHSKAVNAHIALKNRIFGR